MTKQTYAQIRSAMAILAGIAVVAMLILNPSIDSGTGTLIVATLIALVCDIHGVLATAGIVADHYMYPGRENQDRPEGFIAVVPPMLGSLLLAFLCFGTMGTTPAALLILGNFILVMLLGCGLGAWLNRKYRATGEAWYKAKAMTKLDVVMAGLGMDAANQQALRDRMADKTASDVHAAINALKDLNNTCPEALNTQPPQPPQP